MKSFKVSGMLNVNTKTGIPYCSCKLFMILGIPFHHIISYLAMHYVGSLPSELMCKRWFRHNLGRPWLLRSQRHAIRSWECYYRCATSYLILQKGNQIDEFDYVKKILGDGECSSSNKKTRSISRLCPLVRSTNIEVYNSKLAKTKSSRVFSITLKHCERFISRRESMVPRPRVFSICGFSGHNKQRCTIIFEWEEFEEHAWNSKFSFSHLLSVIVVNVCLLGMKIESKNE